MWGHLQHRFEANPSAPRAARRRLRTWLGSLGWPEQEADDVVLAVSEAVSNAAQHAYHPGYPGEINLRAATVTCPNGTQCLSITVTDHGTWNDPAAGAGRPTCADPDAGPAPKLPTHGNGLALIRAATEGLRIDANAAGTRLTMTSHPVESLR
jgi:anti-sigma regulatory factor (Ser/Thr protein kinase)